MRYRITKILLALTLLALFAQCMPALAASTAKVVLSASSLSVDLAQSNTVTLSASVTPATASQAVVWKSGNKKIATVSGGVVKLKRTGTVYIGARPRAGSNWTKCKITVTDSSKPTSMTLNTGSFTMAKGSTFELKPVLSPATAVQTVRYSSSKSAVASVSAQGVITAKKTGTCKIRVVSTKNTSVRKTITVKVIIANAPTKLTISPADKVVYLGDTLKLSVTPTPETADGTVKWKSSNAKIATVNESGLVTPVKAGTVKITAVSAVKSSVSTVRTLTVIDPYAITSVTINSDALYIGKGGTAQLDATVKPAVASQKVTWSSANKSVATVTASGVVSGVGAGTTTITATGADGKTSDTISVKVVSVTRVTTVPDLTTSATATSISANLTKIDNIRLSAYTELEALVAAGKITQSEMKARKNILINAFADLRFPWITKSAFKYWKNNSVVFGTGKVYYGVPYTQGAGTNAYLKRRYNAARLVSGGYYSKGANYYVANNSSGKMTGVTYCGNDCSAFCSMSTWGTGSEYSFLNTTAMYSSTGYKTISKSNLRPGDIVVKKGHVVMFLYWTDSSKSKMMVIEQGGGSEPNTVACRITNKTSASAYIARRKASFAS